jgi:hypothetical protein
VYAAQVDLSSVGGTALSGANTVDAGNSAFRVNVVAGGAGGGLSQLQVRNGSNAWTDVGYFGGDLNVPVQGTVTSNQGSANATPWNENLAQVGGSNIALGQAAMASSIPVAIANNQSAIPASQSGTWNIGTVTSISGGTINAAQSGTWTVGTNSDTTIGGTTAPAKELLVAGKTNDGTPQYQPIPEGAGGRSVIIEGFSGGTNVGVSGTVTANQGGAPWSQNVTQFGSNPVVTGTGASGSGIPRVTISNDSSLAANQSVNMNQFGGSGVTIGQQVAGSSIPVVLPAAQITTLTPPTTVTANQGTANATPWNENVAQFGGNPVATGTGAGGVGIPRVTISNDSSLAANQSVNLNQVGGAGLSIGQQAVGASIPVVLPVSQISTLTPLASVPDPNTASVPNSLIMPDIYLQILCELRSMRLALVKMACEGGTAVPQDFAWDQMQTILGEDN